MVVVWKAKIHMNDTALLGDQVYSNNFHVTTGGSSDDAFSLANQIGEAMAGTILATTVYVDRVSIHNSDVPNGNQSRIVSIAGTRAVTGDPLPGWNVAKVQGSIFDGGRPSTWHFRIGLTEDDVAGQVLGAGVLSALTSFGTALVALTGLCDKDGFGYSSFTHSDLVALRQFEWRRRHRPGFKRGWIPV